MTTLALLQSGGVVGGAGFPTWEKRSVPAGTLLINGAEWKPPLQSGQYWMLRQAQRLVRAARALGEIAGGARIVISLEGSFRITGAWGDIWRRRHHDPAEE